MSKVVPALLLQNASLKVRETTILSNVSMQVQAGEVVVLAGRSGVGKSSLMNLINGFYPNEDSIVDCEQLAIAGENLLGTSLLQRTSYVRSIFQNARLSFAMMTPYEEMVFCLENVRFPVDQMDKKIAQHAKMYGLTELLDRPFAILSGGELQKVAFACASLVDAPLYLMDEPFANIDEANIPYFIEHIKLLRQQGKAVCIIDHRLDFWEWVDRWYVLEDSQQLQVFELPLNEAQKEKLKTNGLLADFPQKRVDASQEKVLRLQDISFYRPDGQTIIRGVSFDLHAGEMLAIVGQSGAGKTSFFKGLLKQYRYEGKIEMLGQDFSAVTKKSLYAQLGLVFQDPSLQFVTTKVSEEVRLSFPYLSNSEREALLAAFDLDKVQHLSPWLISQGQQRRLAFLTMTNKDKRILLVDEPTYGQDLQNAIKIMTTLETLCQQGLACIFTSHDQQLVKQFAHKTMRIHNHQMEVSCDE